MIEHRPFVKNCQGLSTIRVLLEHGMIDAIVDRREIRDYIIKLLNFMMNPEIPTESEMGRLRTRTASGQ